VPVFNALIQGEPLIAGLQNLASSAKHILTHECDRQTDRQTYLQQMLSLTTLCSQHGAQTLETETTDGQMLKSKD